MCTPCQEGHYKDRAGTEACRRCAKNTFNKYRGATAEAQCAACPEGAITATTGATSSDACMCPDRTYMAEGITTSCKTCPIGRNAMCILRIILATRKLTSQCSCMQEGSAKIDRWDAVCVPSLLLACLWESGCGIKTMPLIS